MVSLGSVQSFSIDEETGKVEITLTDGKKLTVDMTGYSLITVEQDEDGEDLFITLDDEDEFEKVANYFDELFDSEVDYDA